MPEGRLDRGDGVELAWSLIEGRGPVVVFLPGYNSDMAGAKASELADHCAAAGQGMLRLDYSGHGASGGAFADGSIGRWAEDARIVTAAVAPGPRILVGSSMGGWIALLLARAQPELVLGLVGIAAAPDFTERLIWQSMAPFEQAALMRDGQMMVPSRYGDPYVVTRALVEDGRTHLLLDSAIPIDCPVRLLQGQQDEEVPWETATLLARRLAGNDVQVTLIKDGDHRLSRPSDLALLKRTVADLLALLGEDGA